MARVKKLTEAEIRRISKEQSRYMQRALLAAWTDIRDNIALDKLIDAIRGGNIAGAMAAIRADEIAFQALTDSIISAYTAGGSATVAAFSNKVIVRFGHRNIRAEEWIKHQSSTLITKVSNQQVEAVRSVMTNGIISGRNPRATALDIAGRIDKVTGKRTGGIIGLNPQQAEYVANARVELESIHLTKNSNYLSRARRDKRFDTMVRKAISDGAPLSQQDINNITRRYSDRLLQLRAETIARTETLNALREGQYEAIKQTAEAGGYDENKLSRRWVSASDGRTRDDHRELNGVTVPFGESFTAADGSNMMFPGDRSLGAPAKQIVNCRCRFQLKLPFPGGSNVKAF